MDINDGHCFCKAKKRKTIVANTLINYRVNCLGNDMSEYAPEYTKKEIIEKVIKMSIWFIPLMLVTHFWFFDWFGKYVENAHCHQYGPITGVHLVFYWLFVGIPLFSFAVLALCEGNRSLKILKVGQNPLPNEKVYKKTKYKYGWKAKVHPVIILSSLCFLVLFSIWGANQAYVLTQDIQSCEQPLSIHVNVTKQAWIYHSILVSVS